MQTQLFGLVVLACPLMFVIGCGHGHDDDETHEQHPMPLSRGAW